MKRYLCLLLVIIMILGVCSSSLACYADGADDYLDMEIVSYWAYNSVYHYMQEEYDYICTKCGRVTHISLTPVLKIHRWSNNRCLDCDYIR